MFAGHNLARPRPQIPVSPRTKTLPRGAFPAVPDELMLDGNARGVPDDESVRGCLRPQLCATRGMATSDQPSGDRRGLEGGRAGR